MASLEARATPFALSSVTSILQTDLGGKLKGSFALQNLVHPALLPSSFYHLSAGVIRVPPPLMIGDLRILGPKGLRGPWSLFPLQAHLLTSSGVGRERQSLGHVLYW